MTLVQISIKYTPLGMTDREKQDFRKAKYWKFGGKNSVRNHDHLIGIHIGGGSSFSL